MTEATDGTGTAAPCFLFLAGSARRDSLNKRLARHASEVATGLGIEARFLDLADHPLPLYHGDLEAEHGVPEPARALKRLFADADGFLVASPEYNGGYSALLKNTLDWMSRRGDDAEDAPHPFRGKVAGIVSASPGRLGGIRALPAVRLLLAELGATVVPAQLAVPEARAKLPVTGPLEDATVRAGLERVLLAMRGISPHR